MKKILISSDELLKLKSLYNDGYSVPELSKITGRTNYIIYKWLNEDPDLKIRSASEAAKKYTIYDNFFDNIDTQEKAYFLGFLYADGNVSDDGSITLTQAEQDKEIIFAFSKLVGKDLRIGSYQDARPNRQKTYIISVRSAHMAENLLNHGCLPRKTFILKFPKLNKKLFPHFIRGYFDGDGCISINKYDRKGRGIFTKNTIVSTQYSYTFSILSTLEFVSELKKIIETELHIHCGITKRHKDRNNNNYTLYIGGRKQIQIVLSWLYTDATICLSRKYNKYLQLCK